jgi:hypothetical protein
VVDEPRPAWIWDVDLGTYRLAADAEVTWTEGSNPCTSPPPPTRRAERHELQEAKPAGYHEHLVAVIAGEAGSLDDLRAAIEFALSRVRDGDYDDVARLQSRLYRRLRRTRK